MKRLMILFAALAAVACAKNNVAEDPAPAAQYLNLTISDFPALESTTRSGETVGKTAWEDGDQLLIVFYSHPDGENIWDNFWDIWEKYFTYYLATYENGGWSLNEPIPIKESDLSNSYLEIYFRQGMKWDVQTGKIFTANEQTPLARDLIQTEYLNVYNFIKSMDHTITFNKKVDANGQLVSSILGRGNRVRIIYKGANPDLSSILISEGGGALTYIGQSFDNGSGFKGVDAVYPNVKLDANKEAVIYLQWIESFIEVDNSKPVLTVNTGTDQNIALPYGDEDNVEAPYPYYEYDFANPFYRDGEVYFPCHYNAYAYSVVVR